MSSIPREALNTRASKPGVIGVPSSTLSALARAISSCGSEMSAGVILFITSAAVKPSIRSAPTLKIWMTPLASVAMLEKLALLKIALCSAPATGGSRGGRGPSVEVLMFDRALGPVVPCKSPANALRACQLRDRVQRSDPRAAAEANRQDGVPHLARRFAK